MAEEGHHDNISPPVVKDNRDIREFFMRLNAASKRVAAYGVDHPGTNDVVDSMSEVIRLLLNKVGRATLIPTKDGGILNAEKFDCKEAGTMFRQLRSRGAVAITFVGIPPVTQLRSFLNFLNSSPDEVRDSGGARSFLRYAGVNQILATDALYMSEDEESEESGERPNITPSNVPSDVAIAYAIEWLSTHDPNSDDSRTSAPIEDILSDPERTAHLVTGAITRMHQYSSQGTIAEQSTQTLDHLRDLAGQPEAWDNALQQIRRAISELPVNHRPLGHGMGKHSSLDDGNDERPTLDCSVAESIIAACIQTREGNTGTALSDEELTSLSGLFGVRVVGQSTGMMRALESNSVLKSSADTLLTLLAWENRPQEHLGIADNLYRLIVQLLDRKHDELALYVIEQMLKQCEAHDSWQWRNLNIKSAIRNVGTPRLKDLALSGLSSSSYQSKAAAALLIESTPDLAINMTTQLYVINDPEFGRAVVKGAAQAGANAPSILGNIIRSGPQYAREAAFEAILGLRSPGVVSEIGRIINDVESGFAGTLLMIIGTRKPSYAGDICVGALSNDNQNIRVAAINTLKELRNRSALPYLYPVAALSLLQFSRLPEKLAALLAIGRLGGEQDVEFLKAIEKKRSILCPSVSGQVSEVARQAIIQIDARTRIAPREALEDGVTSHAA